MLQQNWRELARAVFSQFQKDDMAGEAAKLAFYLVFAIFPFLLFVTAVLGVTLQSASVLRGAIDQYLVEIAPTDAAELIAKTLDNVTKQSSGQKLSFGLLFSLSAASRGMLGLMRALNVAYEVGERRKWWKARLVAIGLTLGLSLLISIALVLVMIGGPFGVNLAEKIGIGEAAAWTWNILRWPIILLLLVFSFNLLYVYAPNLKRRKWHSLMPGTLIAVALWALMSMGFKLYLSHFNHYSGTYGSIGAVIILLTWLYASAAAILIGAEINAELEIAADNVQEKEA